MLALRWCLGVVAGLLGGGFLTLFFVSNGFRRSFGASENSPLLAILPLAALGLLVAGVIAPGSRLLLHVAALTALGLLGFCVWQLIKEAATVMWLALFYLTAWLVFYGLTLSQSVTAR